ncbi:hypothetical protein ACIA8O_35015 [Kitasatospora sp. NPDC051853]|uniref:hypothetical protein n=1 Tax=Kitasatospora sp. NPDC051853 TaxID=3364058 RepID=UPI0037B968A7
MQTDDPTVVDALATGERTYRNSTRLGALELNEQVQGWKVERAYNTDLPSAMRAFAGSSSAQLDLQLTGGPAGNGPALYSPWAPRGTADRVRPGQSVVQSIGLEETGQLPVFRGTVRSRSAASGGDVVQITALDGAERLRGPAHLPKPYAGFLGKQPIASATWCVDELLRQGGVYTCPPPRFTDTTNDQSTVLYVSLHGGFTPANGIPYLVPSAADYGWSRTAAPYEMALVPKKSGLKASWMPSRRVRVPNRTILTEVTVNNLVGAGERAKAQIDLATDDAGYGFGLLRFTVDFNAATVTAWSGREGGAGEGYSWSFPALSQQKGNWQLGMLWDGISSLTYQNDPAQGRTAKSFQVVPHLIAPDGTQLAGQMYELMSPAGLQWESELFRVDLVTDVAAECLQVTGGIGTIFTFPPASFKQSWKKGATLDDVTLPLYSIPTVSGSQWDVISQIAKAALSTAEFDETGVFRWRNHTRFLTAPTRAQRTLTTLRDISALSVSEEIDACRNYCVQPYQDWSKVETQKSEVFRDSGVRTVPAYGSVEIAYTKAVDEPDIWPPLVDCDLIASEDSAVRFALANAANQGAQKGRVETSVRRDGGTLYLLLRNMTGAPVYTVNKDGSGSVRLIMPIPKTEPVNRTAIVQNKPSQTLYGLQQYTAEATDWVQDYDTAVSLAAALEASGRFPIPVFGGVEVLYDPRLQLGDVVQLVDTAGAYLDTLAWVIGISVEAGPDGAIRQTLTLRGTSWPSGQMDVGITPDPPVDPAVWNRQPYKQVAERYPSYAHITQAGRSCKDLWTR